MGSSAVGYRPPPPPPPRLPPHSLCHCASAPASVGAAHAICPPWTNVYKCKSPKGGKWWGYILWNQQQCKTNNDAQWFLIQAEPQMGVCKTKKKSTYFTNYFWFLREKGSKFCDKKYLTAFFFQCVWVYVASHTSAPSHLFLHTPDSRLHFTPGPSSSC